VLPRVEVHVCIILRKSLGGGLFGFDISSMSGVLATQVYCISLIIELSKFSLALK
jgi:hypothetical protein